MITMIPKILKINIMNDNYDPPPKKKTSCQYYSIYHLFQKRTTDLRHDYSNTGQFHAKQS